MAISKRFWWAQWGFPSHRCNHIFTRRTGVPAAPEDGAEAVPAPSAQEAGGGPPGGGGRSAAVPTPERPLATAWQRGRP